MSTATASIRELRTDFRAVKRKIEQHGEIIITDHGDPAYVIKPVPAPRPARKTHLPDYYARLLARQPKAMTAEETRKFWDEERGNR
jgi:antitoxin (DNA-binding transcriptional repressor) of toxin-antitoxin stability system